MGPYGDPVHRHQGEVGERVEYSQSVLLVGIRPRQEQEGNRQLLTPQDTASEDDGDGAGNEDGQREEVDSVEPEQGRHAGREQFIDGHSGEDQGDPDGVVHLSVVDRRLGLEGPGTNGGQRERDERHQADIGKRRLLVDSLQQSAQRIVVGNQHGADEHTHLDPCSRGLRCIGPASPPCVLPILERGAPSGRRRGVERFRHVHAPRPVGDSLSSGRNRRTFIRRHRARSPRSSDHEGRRRSLRSGRLRRCAPVRPRRRPGTAHRCRKPVAPAACCGSR